MCGEEFLARLKTDWIYQDHGLETTTCFSNAENSQCEEAMVNRVLAGIMESEYESNVDQLKSQMASLQAEKAPGNDPRWKDLYFSACEIRRKIRLAAAADACPELVYTTHHVMGGSHYTYTEDVADADILDMNPDRKPGASLCRLSLDANGAITHEILLSTETGIIRDPDVSWDGKKILFAMRTDLVADEFHIYEYNLETNSCRQITFGNGFGDIEPVYLPDNNILFVSTRCMQISSCNPTECSNMYVMDGDGRFLRRLGFDQVDTNYPKVLEDGRVIYTRWEYNDRTQVFLQPLFVMNPDGTGQTEYYGNNSWWPTSILHARGIPGTNRILAIAAGHHTHQRGKLILIDRSTGNQENEGASYAAPMQKAERARVDSANQDGEQFAYPCPISEQECYVSYLPEESPFRWGDTRYPVPFGLYYFDLDGNRELLAWNPEFSSMQATILAPRENRVTRPSVVDLKKTTGTFYVQDVYEGPGLKNIPRGTIKKLRVISPLFARNCMAGRNQNFGPGGFGWVPTPPSVFNGTWDVKIVLGDVPVEEDGSAFFEVPARTPVYFQLLDERGDMVQTMRSWSTLQPGENFYCIGCHEPKVNAPGNVGSEVNTRTMAMNRPPAVPVSPFSIDRSMSEYDIPGFSFLRDVQPVFDRHCVTCHIGGTNDDGTPKPASLLANEYNEPPGKYLINKLYDYESCSLNDSLRQFTEGYLWLTDRGNCNHLVTWLHAQDGPEMIAPYSTGAAVSGLLRLLREKDDNHKNLNISQEEIHRIATWIDLGIPFVGSYTEANNWPEDRKALWAYYGMKQKKMADIIELNLKDLIEFEAGRVPLPDVASLRWFYDGGPAARDTFVRNWLNRELPVTGRKTGPENLYRNLALNTLDVQGDAVSYPHAYTNSEYAWRSDCSAKNVIDGVFQTESEKSVPVWRPNKRTDLRLGVEFGHTVTIDKMVVQVRPDPENARVWNTVSLEFANGYKVTITLAPVDKPQTFSFPPQQTDKACLCQWQQESKSPLADAAVVELQFWGTTKEQSDSSVP
ncbi:MAG: hypothetical protein Q4G68_09615 [Planctomycetia bacterium]|nr:hypothetical protein [Planctomycetia bacterium]